VVKPIGFSFSMAPEQNSLVFMKTTVLMVLSLCLASGGLTAQAIAQQTSRSATSAAKALTNDDVLRMVRGGLPTRTIILAIQNGETTFDTSPDALLALRRSRVAQSIIDAMIAGGRKPAPLPAISTPAQDSDQDLGDAFSKAALRALRAIEEENGASSLYNRPDSRADQRKVLQIMGAQEADPREYRQTQTTIDTADSEATSPQEKEIVATLRNLLIVKLAINRNWRIAMVYGGSASVADKVFQNNLTSTMLYREKGCIQDLEPALRERKLTSIPSWCTDLKDYGSDF
jgi:hypothetical protein